MHAYQDAQGYQIEPEDEEMETVYVYMTTGQPEPPPEEQQPRQPEPPIPWARVQQWLLGGLAVVLLAGLCLLPERPVYVTRIISVPAIPLPLVRLSASVSIIPTGVTTIPATRAYGLLTVYNGSILQEALPAGFIVTTHGGVEIAIDQAVVMPAANPPTEGTATVAAHAVMAGAAGNIPAGSVNQAYGTSLVVKNLAAFTGGQEATNQVYVTVGDQARALASARAQVEAQRPIGLQKKPCSEQNIQTVASVTVHLTCQFVTYKVPRGVQVIGVVGVQDERIMLQVRVREIPQ